MTDHTMALALYAGGAASFVQSGQDRGTANLPTTSLAEAGAAGWPVPEQQGGRGPPPESHVDLFRLLRNGISHGNLSFLPDGHGRIQAIRIENYDQHNMRALLHRFVALVGEGDHEARQPKRSAKVLSDLPGWPIVSRLSGSRTEVFALEVRISGKWGSNRRKSRRR